MQRVLRQKRHLRLRSKVKGTAERPRVSVFRSSRSLNVQLVDDSKHATLLSINGQTKAKQTKTAQAEAVGKEVATAAKAAGIKRVVFDRAGYKYHGRIKVLAEALRAGGLDF
ncbi:MAG: 50S ribosomal protein L18 [Candidatus Andersenbacteria bacterium]